LDLVKTIEKHGLLPMHDSHALSATTLLAKEPVHGSWWAHPKANEMYRAITAAEDHEDVAIVKLLGGKLTFVHRRLWLSLLSVATERAGWQVDDLPSSVEKLLEKIERAKLRGDAIRELKKEVKLIEDRLLAYVSNEHTEAGRHEKVLESWDAWKKRVGLKGKKPTGEKGRKELEEAASAFAPLRLPWVSKRTR
jgi:hypothetical protein